ncbi:MAG: helix-turn-helix domain-containing protein [Chloroflexi bacterium]|nr:helix-turn-helix domain-containing protein [Chloroflexota bacterium]
MRKDRLRDWIYKRDLNPASLAELMSVSERQIWRWMNGDSDAGSEMVKQIAEHLNISADFLLGLSDDPTPHFRIDNLTEDEMRVLAAMRRGDDKAIMGILARR